GEKMIPQEIKTLIEAGLNSHEVEVNGEGNMFDVTVVSNDFEGKSLVKKQQMVYATVNKQISNGDIHALTIKTFTEKEWQTASKLKIS
ncbi:MAG: BolA family protein, partial [Pseudomonadota bacterium]